MTADLTPKVGRVFIGMVFGHPHLLVVRSVRHRRNGTASSCTLAYEEPGVSDTPVEGELRVSLPDSGELTGYRRVTLAKVGTARAVADECGKEVFTDAVTIVTRDRVGGGEIFGKGM